MRYFCLLILACSLCGCLKHYKVEPAQERTVSPNVKRQAEELGE